MTGKKNITISIDVDVYDKLKGHRLNISGEINTYLKNYLDVDRDGEFFDIMIEKQRLEELKIKQIEISSHITNINSKVEAYEQRRKEAEIKRIELEKQKAIEAQTCKNCGIVINPGLKSHKFKVGLICNACFMSSGKDGFKKWNTQQ